MYCQADDKGLIKIFDAAIHPLSRTIVLNSITGGRALFRKNKKQ